MKINKKVFSLILLINLTFVFSFSGIIGCSNTIELKQPKTEETNENSINKLIPDHKDKINRLTQNLPLSKEIVQDKVIHYKCDPQRTGVFKGENPKLKGEVLWSFETEKEETDPKYIERRSSPIIFEDILYIGNIDHNIYAIDANSGKLKWSFKTDGPITSSPALWNRTLYFGSEDNFFYAVNIDTHKLRWKYKTDGPITSSPSIIKQRVFFGSDDGIFYALNALTGKLQWKYNTKQTITCEAAILNDNIYFVSNPKEIGNLTDETNTEDFPRIFSINLISGRKSWDIKREENYLGPICISNNHLYCVFFNFVSDREFSNGGIIDINLLHDKINEKSVTKFTIMRDIALPTISCTGKILCFVCGDMYAINIDPYKGKYFDILWKYQAETYYRKEKANLVIPPSFNNDETIAYSVDNEGYLRFINLITGREIYYFKLTIPKDKEENGYSEPPGGGIQIKSTPVLYKGKIYVYSWEEIWNIYDLSDRKNIGVLYCIQ
jgi:outer membrane protein assembly factor BamB